MNIGACIHFKITERLENMHVILKKKITSYTSLDLINKSSDLTLTIACLFISKDVILSSLRLPNLIYDVNKPYIQSGGKTEYHHHYNQMQFDDTSIDWLDLHFFFNG